jgi:hypothetical protein
LTAVDGSGYHPYLSTIFDTRRIDSALRLPR